MIIEVHYVAKPVHYIEKHEYRKFETLELAKFFAEGLNQYYYENPYIRIVKDGEVKVINY
jgi:hypothetical protein